MNISHYKIKQENGENILIVYLDSSQEEFSVESGDLTKPPHRLKQQIQSLIKKNFPI